MRSKSKYQSDDEANFSLNVYWPLHGNEKWMLRIRKGQREGNEEVRGELGATLGPILRTRDCPRCANVSIIIQFFTLFHVLKLH